MHDRLPSHSIPTVVQKAADRLRDLEAKSPQQPWRDSAAGISTDLGIQVDFICGEIRPEDSLSLAEALRTCTIVLQAPEGWEVRFHLSDCAPAHAMPDLRAHAAVSAPMPNIHHEAYLIQELALRERMQGPVAVTHIVTEVIPQMGFGVSQARRVLQAMEAEGMIHLQRDENVRGGEPALVTLNRSHPHVKRVLQGPAGSKRAFPIATIKGTPLSEIIIQDRR